eukprot:TRINITY_DN2624_c0_g1_i1.p1 TRINITY_DN2624_c0_g1~~TRINITY_DN2624_c0_g1_i1.p1  ORF type:complete len:377 (+),score=143.30 TRINITY_DN2624_c0_g1_i1:61-1131(+)
MPISAKPEVESLKPYVAPLEGRLGMLRLDFNENTVGPSPGVLKAIRELPASAYATYPAYSGLTDRYAGYIGVPADSVGLFNGVDAAIRALFDAFGSRGDVFLQTAPTFGYYTPCAKLQGMEVVSVPYNRDLSYPFDAVRQRLVSAPPRMLFICNPNNPTGTLLEPAKIFELAQTAPDTLIVVDELYHDFTGVSVLPEGLKYPNLLVLRSLSKAQGIAALRVGFVVGPPRLLDRAARTTGPYDVNMFGVVASNAVLDDAGFNSAYVKEVNDAKEWTVAALRQRGVRVHSEGGNYILVWPPAGLTVEGVEDALRRKGVLVRPMSGKPLIGESIRVSIGRLDQMKTFMAAFDAVLKARL